MKVTFHSYRNSHSIHPNSKNNQWACGVMYHPGLIGYGATREDAQAEVFKKIQVQLDALNKKNSSQWDDIEI